MKGFRKKVKSVLVALIAVLSVLPPQTAQAANTTISTVKDANDSVVHWGTGLPSAITDTSYKTDTNWYRLILECNDWQCTNAISSSGNYSSPSSEKSTSWPSAAWHNTTAGKQKGSDTDIAWPDMPAATQPENWIGKNKYDHFDTMSQVRNDDTALYREGEYTMNGLYSLYIKYAGTAKDGKTPCYYISPCDEKGNRAKKLWALDCCLDMAADDNEGGRRLNDAFYHWSQGLGTWPGMKAIVEGIEPTFTLLTPTFNEFETSDTFKHAGLAVPYYQDDFYAFWNCADNNGHLWGDYIDNHKWIFTQNTDGSWNIKSAGYIDWDWNAADGDLAVMFGEDRYYVFQMGAGAYIKSCCYGQLNGEKSRDDDGEEYAIIERYYLSSWVATVTRDLMDRDGIPLVPMIWLSDYAQNVYITAAFYLGGTDDGFAKGITKKNLYPNKISTACGAYWKNDWDVDEYDAWVDWDIERAHYKDQRYYSSAHNNLAVEQMIFLDSSGKAKTVEEIKKIMKLGPYKFWSPSSVADGAWSGMYIGTPVATERYNSDDSNVTISAGVTKVLGASDKNGDGVCDGAAYIGSLDGAGCIITIEEGATLEIDGPTYVAGGTVLNVSGDLIISPGAYLCVEDGKENRSVVINIEKNGKVIISAGAMLDLDYGTGYILIRGGALINNGVCIIGQPLDGEEPYVCVYMHGGEIQNGPTGCFITGATIDRHQRMTFLKEATKTGSSFSSLSSYFDNMYDNAFGKYINGTLNVSAFSVADIKMYDEENANSFTNEGIAYIGGAMKAEEGSDSSFMGKGQLYRFWDIYQSKMESYTKKRKRATNLEPKEDEADIAFYALDNIYNGEVNGDPEGETQCLKDNVLALRVGTGSEGTDKISAFKIKYVATNGGTYSLNVSPAAEENSYNLVKEYNYCGLTQNVSGASELRTHAWGEVFSEAGFTRELEPYSNTTYFFQTQYPVKYVKSITIIGAGTGSWSCTELSLYRVKYLFPLKEYGWSSWDWYAPFTGTLLAQVPLTEDTELGVNGSVFLWTSENIVFGSGTYPLNVYEVPANVTSKSDESGFCYYNASTETVEYSTKDETYLFSTSLADAENAGIESRYIVNANTSFSGYYTKNQVMSLETEAYIMMQVRYIDTNGSIRTASMNSTLNAVDWANYCLDETEKQQILHGLFQQGEDIAFEGELPDYKKLYSVSLGYKDNESASISVTSFALIKPDNIQTNRTNYTIADGVLTPDTSGTPTGFYNAGDLKGTYVSSGQTMTVYTKEWNGTENVKPSQKGSRYLVVVRTDEMSDAATMRDISVQFTYKTLADMPATTRIYDLRSAVNDYYGYWLSADGKDEDCAYKSAVSKDGELRFVIDADNLYKFTSATFSMEADTTISTNLTDYDSTGKDEWQMSTIDIYEVTELGARKVLMGNGVTATGITTNRTYYRDSLFGQRGVINSGKGPLMVSPGQSKTINFSETTGGGSTITGGGEATSKNKLTDVQELTYYETKQDFGLNARRTAYNITVHVAGKSITSVEDGDCGSKNQFYFQLVFQDENGKQRTSPTVLSNQQLRSDGFRTGTEEEFSIYTNDDYGTPIQINIIPDDTSSTSDVFDKLCIDYITVSKTSSTGVSLNWKTDEVGWIDIEYKDDQGEQTGRTDAELIRSFELKDAGYNVWIELGITTAAEYIGTGQFVGQVTADITYRNASGAVKVKTVPIVGRIADYCERKSELGTATEDGTEVSIPLYMFRKGYTNRFLVQFDDIKSLINMKLTVTPSDNTFLAVDRVFARQVFDQGTLSLNKLNEYEHHYNETPNDLTTSTNASTVRIEPRGGSATATFVFSSGNSIIFNSNENGESLTVTEGETEGEKDYITMTAEIEDITGIDFNSSISANVIYKNIYGDLCSVKTSLIYDNTSKRFVIPKDSLPTTSNIGMAYRLELTSSSLAGRVFKSATVCQMRGDAVLHEVVFEPGKDTKLDAEVPLTISIPESQVDIYAEEKGYVTNTQNLFLQTTGTLSESVLLSKNSDIQVALVYTKKGDEYYEHKYESDYISVLESGYSILYGDMTLVIPFHVSDVGGITGIKLKTNNSAMKLSFAQGCVAVNEVSDLTNKLLFTGWVNLPTASENVTVAGITMSSDGLSLTEALTSANRLTPANTDIDVSKVNRIDAVIGVYLFYTDTYGVTKSVGGAMSANDWNYTGGWTLIKDFKTPVYFTMEAIDYDDNNTAGATVSGAILSWYDANGVKCSSGLEDPVALLEGKKVSSSLVTTALTGTVKSGDGKQSVTLESNLIKDGRTDYSTLKFIGKGTVSISASLPGLPGELEISCVNTETGEQLFPPVASYATGETVSYSYYLSPNTGTATLHYCITVASKNMPHQYAAKVYFDVEPAVYIEGYVCLPGGTPSGFIATDAAGVLFTKWFTLNKGDVITVYARVRNNSNTALSYTIEPADGTVFTVTSEENATVYGNAGTYTLYKITAETNVRLVNSQFKVYSVVDPTVSYTLAFESASAP